MLDDSDALPFCRSVKKQLIGVLLYAPSDVPVDLVRLFSLLDEKNSMNRWRGRWMRVRTMKRVSVAVPRRATQLSGDAASSSSVLMGAFSLGNRR